MEARAVQRGRDDVLEIAALFEELIAQRSQRVVHALLGTLWCMELVPNERDGSPHWTISATGIA